MRWFARFVEDVRVLEPGGDGVVRIERLPDGGTLLVVRVLDGSGDLTVSGPRTRALFKRTTGVSRVVIVTLKPGWSLPLLGISANALTDRIVPLHELWGRAGADLRDDVLTAPSTSEMLDRISHAMAVYSRNTLESTSARLARRAVRLLEGDDICVGDVAKQLGVTCRHLRRAFVENIGVGPKDFARTVRLRRAVQRAASSTDWGRIAADAGYYDQAHLIGDFRQLVGMTPGAFAKRTTSGALPQAR